MSEPTSAQCPHGDLVCPCQDGDACHYRWAGDSPPMACPRTGRRDGLCCTDGEPKEDA